MIFAGIDEAGLGPMLGPLVTASTAFLVPDHWQGKADTLWLELASAVCGKPSKKDARLLVADSKVVHAAVGLQALEMGVAVFLACADNCDPEQYLPWLDLESSPRECPWHENSGRPFPVMCDGDDIGERQKALSSEMRRVGVSIRLLQCKALHPSAINAAIDAGQNKNQILLGETGSHLVRLVNEFGKYGLEVWIDKQGGRNDYLPYLSHLFPGVWIDTLESGKDVSEYRLRLDEGAATLHFCAKADRFSFMTALASMAAKYARERLMQELNDWFCARIDNLQPTAGYPQDAKRWLKDAAEFLSNASFPMQIVVRER
jgi:Ribonuclease HII